MPRFRRKCFGYCRRPVYSYVQQTMKPKLVIVKKLIGRVAPGKPWHAIKIKKMLMQNTQLLIVQFASSLELKRLNKSQKLNV